MVLVELVARCEHSEAYFAIYHVSVVNKKTIVELGFATRIIPRDTPKIEQGNNQVLN